MHYLELTGKTYRHFVLYLQLPSTQPQVAVSRSAYLHLHLHLHLHPPKLHFHLQERLKKA